VRRGRAWGERTASWSWEEDIKSKKKEKGRTSTVGADRSVSQRGINILTPRSKYERERDSFTISSNKDGGSSTGGISGTDVPWPEEGEPSNLGKKKKKSCKNARKLNQNLDSSYRQSQ